jgi:hypothetical protein
MSNEFHQLITSEIFSLLKFPSQDVDYSLDCLAGNLSPTSKYITIFPVKCTSKIANAYFCSCVYLECHGDSFEQLDMLVNPAFEQDLNNGILVKTNQVMKTINSLDLTKTFKNIFRTMWHSGLPCFDLKNVTADKEGDRSILKYCEWKGMPIPCSAIFSTFPTDRGMCCSFHMETAEAVFNGQTYPKIVHALQMEDRNNSLANVTI